MSLTDWACEFFLGLYGAWLATVIWDRLCLWWQEGQAELRIETMEHDDPMVRP